MDSLRAQEIAESPIMADVRFQGSRVYIQHVDNETETARVYPLGRPEQEQDVPLDSLIEH